MRESVDSTTAIFMRFQQTTENNRAEPSARLTHLRCHEMLECHDLTPQVWEMLAVQRKSDNDTVLMAEYFSFAGLADCCCTAFIDLLAGSTRCRPASI